MLFPELVSPGKYKQVKIGREEIRKTLVRMGRFYLSYVEQENLLHRSFPPEIPNKISCYLLIRFHKKTIPLSVHNYRAFTLISVRGLPSYVPRSKDRPPLKELSIYSLSWSGPADSHFVHSFFHKCIVFIYQPG